MGTEDGGRKKEDGGQRSEDSKAENRKLKAEMGAGQGSEFEMPKAAVVQVDFQAQPVAGAAQVEVPVPLAAQGG